MHMVKSFFLNASIASQAYVIHYLSSDKDLVVRAINDGEFGIKVHAGSRLCDVPHWPNALWVEVVSLSTCTLEIE